jgi:putative nucleotidyltransferase with HDIG domain
MPGQNGTRSVLIVMDETGVSAAVMKVLRDEGLAAELVTSRALAEAALITDAFDLILCEAFVGTSASNTDQLLQQLRAQSSAPIIAIVDDSANQASQFGADLLIPKPFGREALLSAVAQASALAKRPVKMAVRKRNLVQKEDEPVEEELSGEFCKIGINEVLTAGSAPYDVYVKIREGKFVRVTKQGEPISFERICSYQLKGIEHLFVRKEDHRREVIALLEWHELQAFSPIARDSSRRALLGRIFDEGFSNVALRGVKRVDFEWAKTTLENTLIVASDCDQVFGLLADLEYGSRSLFEHSLAVGLYSILLAKEMAWTAPEVLLKVGLAGVFHDVGLTGASDILAYKSEHGSNLEHQLTEEDRAFFESHVERGTQLLLQVPGLPDDIIKMVEQHHRYDDRASSLGEWRKLGIHPMSRLIAMVDDFCKLTHGPATHSDQHPTPAETLKAMNERARGSFEARLLGGLKKVFQVEEDYSVSIA